MESKILTGRHIERPFPKLMINKKFGFVIIATGYLNEDLDDDTIMGSVVFVPNDFHYHGLGAFCDNWTASELEDFGDEVLLKN